MLYDLTASIVSYNNNCQDIRKVINSVLGTSHTITLFIIDNSPSNMLQFELKTELEDKRIVYLHSPGNLGFGQGHNIAIKKAVQLSAYHIVLNPDLEFSSTVIDHLFTFMEANPDVGQVLPKVCYQDGSLLHCKLLPRPLDLFCRRFFGHFKFAAERNRQYEIDGYNYEDCVNLPNLSGCFMFLRSSSLARAGGFDKRYFMYLEDVDLTRRIHRIAKTLYYPLVSITHEHQRGSYNDKKLLFYHIVSAIKYFSKWGWIFDNERVAFNKSAIMSIKTNSLVRFNNKTAKKPGRTSRKDKILIPV